MIREFKNETIVITKEAYFFMKNEDRKKVNVVPLTEEQFEKFWLRLRFRNQGANPKTHPIKENEIRVGKDSFLFKVDKVKEMLTENGFAYRQDGFVEEGIYVR